MARKQQVAASDIDLLAAHLKSFYSPGQLTLYYDVLTDSSPIPDMNDTERQARVQAIDLIRQRERDEIPQAKSRKPK